MGKVFCWRLLCRLCRGRRGRGLGWGCGRGRGRDHGSRGLLPRVFFLRRRVGVTRTVVGGHVQLAPLLAVMQIWRWADLVWLSKTGSFLELPLL